MTVFIFMSTQLTHNNSLAKCVLLFCKPNRKYRLELSGAGFLRNIHQWNFIMFGYGLLSSLITVLFWTKDDLKQSSRSFFALFCPILSMKFIYRLHFVDLALIISEQAVLSSRSKATEKSGADIFKIVYEFKNI